MLQEEKLHLGRSAGLAHSVGRSCFIIIDQQLEHKAYCGKPPMVNLLVFQMSDLIPHLIFFRFFSQVAVGKFLIFFLKPDFACDTDCKHATTLEKEKLGIKLCLAPVPCNEKPMPLVKNICGRTWFPMLRTSSFQTCIWTYPCLLDHESLLTGPMPSQMQSWQMGPPGPGVAGSH